MEPVSPALAGGCFTPEPPNKTRAWSLNHWMARKSYTLEKYWGSPKAFVFCELYLSLFIILDSKSDKKFKHLFTNSFKITINLSHSNILWSNCIFQNKKNEWRKAIYIFTNSLISALTEDSWILLFLFSFSLLQCHTSCSVWKTLLYTYEKVRVNTQTISYYKDSFDNYGLSEGGLSTLRGPQTTPGDLLTWTVQSKSWWMAMGFRTQGEKWPLWKAPFWFQSSKASFGTKAEKMGGQSDCKANVRSLLMAWFSQWILRWGHSLRVMS